MILNITCKHDKEYIQSILEEDLNLTYFRVTYRQSYGHSIHEFFVDDRTDEERCLDLLTLKEIAADLNLESYELRIIATPND